MRASVWWGLATVLAVLAAAALWGAFTRFDAAPAPSPGSPAFKEYESRRYAEARQSTVLGLGSAFLALAAVACARQARARATPAS